MANGNSHLGAFLSTAVGTVKSPVIAAALLLAGVIFNYYMTAQKTQDNAQAIQELRREQEDLKRNYLSIDEYRRSQQELQNHLDELERKIDRESDRIDAMLNESGRRAAH